MASTTTLLARDLLYAEEEEDDDDDYIDMEVSSFSNLFSYSETTTSPHPVVVANEFEFQMSSSSSSSINNVVEKEPTTSPADELFYKGKLLPLHLPPRLQMVEKLLQNTNNNNNNSTFDYKEEHENEEFYSSSTPLAAGTTFTTPIAGTPFESCNISPSESCQISRELNPEEYYYNRSTEFVIENYNYKMKSWTKKLKESSLGSKLKASRAYLKSWFGKSGCSYETYGTSTKVADEGSVSKASWKVINKKVVQGAKKNPFGQIQQSQRNQVLLDQSISSSVKDEMKSSSTTTTITSEEMNESNNSHHDHHRRRRRSRRSFSVVGIKLLSAGGNKSSTSTSSSSSYGISEAHHHHHLKRCSSSTASSEIENSIQGAIAHCKNSHQMLSSRN